MQAMKKRELHHEDGLINASSLFRTAFLHSQKTIKGWPFIDSTFYWKLKIYANLLLFGYINLIMDIGY